MKLKILKVLTVLISVMFVVAFVNICSAADLPDNQNVNGDINLVNDMGDDDAPADYKIDGETVLRRFYNEEYDSYSDTTKTQSYLALGNNAGSSHVTSFNCSQLTDPDERSNCYQMDFSNFNIFIGDEAGRDFTRGRGNTFIGHQAAKSGGYDDGTGWTARQNVVIGTYANGGGKLQAYNTVVGALAGYSNEGSFNTFIGTEAGGSVSTGTANILMGVAAGQGHYRGRGYYPIKTGSNNIHIGTQTEVDSPDISHTIAFGDLTRVEESHQMVVGSDVYWICVYDPVVDQVKCGGSTQCAADPGTELLSCEYANIRESYWGSGIRSANPESFSINTTGGEGTDVSGAHLTLAAGKGTGSADGGFIVFSTSPAGTSGDTQNGLVDRIIISPDGNVAIGYMIPQYPLHMQSGAHVTTGGVWTNASSREYKENINDLSFEKALETLKGLTPVEYNYKTDQDEKYVGFVAEDVPELVATNDRKGLSPMDIVAVLTSVVKEQQKIAQQQQETISELSEKITDFEKELKLRGSFAMSGSDLR